MGPSEPTVVLVHGGVAERGRYARNVDCPRPPYLTQNSQSVWRMVPQLRSENALFWLHQPAHPRHAVERNDGGEPGRHPPGAQSQAQRWVMATVSEAVAGETPMRPPHSREDGRQKRERRSPPVGRDGVRCFRPTCQWERPSRPPASTSSGSGTLKRHTAAKGPGMIWARASLYSRSSTPPHHSTRARCV